MASRTEYAAAALALGPLLLDDRIRRHHHEGEPPTAWFDFPSITEDSTWSDGERAIINIAWTLWNPRTYTSGNVLGQLLELVDGPSFARCLEAIAFRRGLQVNARPAT